MISNYISFDGTKLDSKFEVARFTRLKSRLPISVSCFLVYKQPAGHYLMKLVIFDKCHKTLLRNK